MRIAWIMGLLASLLQPLRGADAERAAFNAKLAASREKAAQYLLAQHQGDGVFGKSPSSSMPGVTALVVRSVAKHSSELRPAGNAALKQGVEYLLKCQDANGAIFLKEFGIENLNTCVALSALSALQDPALRTAVEKAKAYVLSCQMTDEKHPESERIGAFSEGKEANFNLMSTSMSIDALRDAGLEKSSEVYKRAAAFVRRCQDETELNPSPLMRTGASSGAFVYYPGFSEHGTTRLPNGRQVPQPYGSMTYEAVKSLVYCGIERDDPALQAAFRWILQHYSASENPGAVRNQAYFYYALSFAKAFAAMQKKELDLPDGRKTEWGRDLAAHLMSIQRPDGSFLNREPRWLEDNPVICTAFALEALTLCAQALQ